MNRNLTFIVTAVVILLIAASALVVYSDLSKAGYEYRVVKENVEFLSNGMPPQDYCSSFSPSPSFLIVPEFSDEYASPEMTSALTLFSAVLNANGKETIVAGRILDNAGNTLKCRTNRGDAKTNEEIGAEECDALLADGSYVVVRIRMIDTVRPLTSVVLSERTIEILPNSAGGLGLASFLTLDSMFPNTEEIISGANELLGALGG